MKRMVLVALLCCIVHPAHAQQPDKLHIEALQVSDIEVYTRSYAGFLEELARSGIVEGRNLVVHRHIIDAKADPNLWQKVNILIRIKGKASEIVDAKPDLVLTIGTPATKYSMDKFVAAGIPVVFTAVANPLVLGCPSLERPLPGTTGATLYLDPLALLKLSQMALPTMKSMGMIYSDDDNAVAFVEEARKKAETLGITVVPKQVKKSDPIRPAAAELVKHGVDCFGVPLDAYYGLRDTQPGRDILAFARESNRPLFAYANFPLPGATLYIGPDFSTVGALSGKQAARIILNKVKPGTLPILRQQELTVLFDPQAVQRHGLKFSPALQQLAKPAKYEK